MESVQDKTESRLTLSDVKYNVTLPADTFQRTHLTR
jgi:outer membrane lipoprotein-sorting protein